MSHFVVGVIVDKPELRLVDEALAPFDENIKVPKYVEYTKEQLIEKGKKEFEQYKNTTYKEFLENPDEYEKNCTNKQHIKYLKEEFPKQFEWTDEDFYKEEIHWYEPNEIGKNGEVYSTYNPKSKWDWYNICPKETTHRYISATEDNAFYQIKDFPRINQEEYLKAIRFWEVEIDGQPLKEGEEPFFNHIKKEWYLKTFKNKEMFANVARINHPYALLFNGEWFEKGKIYGFGFSDETSESLGNYLQLWNRIINDPKNQDKYIALVNCHI
ncbi:MAG: hypothetical protein [Podoviridae sp. ctcf755]|nr:MAG: hypothetical protein [Podoviridae sp. ctcf755]